METGDLATWLASAVAVVAFCFAAYERRQSNRSEAANRELKERAASREDQRHALEIQSWADQHFQAMQRWAEEVCLTISEARHLVRSSPEYSARKVSIMARLSASIDTGRWYFPNTQADAIGLHKEPAYRGYRQPVLAYVVAAYRALEDDRPDEEAREELLRCQRLFVSDVQLALDPRRRGAELDSYRHNTLIPVRQVHNDGEDGQGSATLTK